MPLTPDAVLSALANREGEEVSLTVTPEKSGEMLQIVGRFVRLGPPSDEAVWALARHGFVPNASDQRVEVLRSVICWRASEELLATTGHGVPPEELEAAKLDGRMVPDLRDSPFRKLTTVPLTDIEEIQFPACGAPGKPRSE